MTRRLNGSTHLSLPETRSPLAVCVNQSATQVRGTILLAAATATQVVSDFQDRESKTSAEDFTEAAAYEIRWHGRRHPGEANRLPSCSKSGDVITSETTRGAAGDHGTISLQDKKPSIEGFLSRWSRKEGASPGSALPTDYITLGLQGSEKVLLRGTASYRSAWVLPVQLNDRHRYHTDPTPLPKPVLLPQAKSSMYKL